MPKYKYIPYVLFHPLEGFDEMRHKKTGSVFWSIIIFIAFALSIAFKQRYIGKQFQFIDETSVNLQLVFFCTLGLTLTIAIANWAISVLLDGKAKLKDIWIIINYSLIPYTAFSYLYIIISNVATIEEGVLLNIVLYFGILWSTVLIIRSLMVFQEFSFSKTLASILLTAIGEIIILFLAVLIFSLFQQFFSTVSTIFYEITFRLK